MAGCLAHALGHAADDRHLLSVGVLPAADLGGGWAPVAEDAAKAGNRMVWEVAEEWLKARGGKVAPRQLNNPRLVGGVLPNPGYAG